MEPVVFWKVLELREESQARLLSVMLMLTSANIYSALWDEFRCDFSSERQTCVQAGKGREIISVFYS